MKLDAHKETSGFLFNMRRECEKDQDLEYQAGLDREARNSLALSIVRFLEPYLPIKVERMVDREVRSTRLYVISHEQFVQIVLKELDPLIAFCSTQMQRDEMRETFRRVLQILDSDSLTLESGENEPNDAEAAKTEKTAETARNEPETANLVDFIERCFGWKMDVWQKEIFHNLERTGKIQTFWTRGDIKKT